MIRKVGLTWKLQKFQYKFAFKCNKVQRNIGPFVKLSTNFGKERKNPIGSKCNTILYSKKGATQWPLHIVLFRIVFNKLCNIAKNWLTALGLSIYCNGHLLHWISTNYRRDLHLLHSKFVSTELYTIHNTCGVHNMVHV